MSFLFLVLFLFRNLEQPNHTTNQRAALMSRNPRKFRQPVRLIVSVEAVTVDAIDAAMKAGGNQGHHNRSEFVRLAVERELGRCQSDDFQTSSAREAD